MSYLDHAIWIKHFNFAVMNTPTDIESHIIETARNVFLENGYAEVNMSQIAQAAVISRPTLYYYYRSKDKLFQEVLGGIVRSVIPTVVDILHGEMSAAEKIARLVDVYFEIFSEHPQIPMFMLKEINRNSEHFLHTIHEMKVEEYFRELIAAYQEEIEKGEMKDVPLFAIFMTFYGLVAIPFLTGKLANEVFVKQIKGNGQPSDNIDLKSDRWTVADNFSDLLAAWKPYLVSSLCNLMIP